MKSLIVICCVTIVTVTSENDGWVWNDDKETRSRSDKTKYQVNENLEDLTDEGPFVGFRPQNPGPYGPNSRPIQPGHPGKQEILVGPGGPTGVKKRPYYPGNTHTNEGIIDSGFIPPWIKEDPRYREYDTCRCRYSFNCPSTGLKFGTCSKDKKYCCFNSRKYPTLVPGHTSVGHHTSHPSSPHKYGPVGFAPSSNYHGNRGQNGNIYSGHRNPDANYHFSGDNGNYYHRPGGNSYGHYNHDSSIGAGSDEFDYYARSLNQNQKNTESKVDEKISTE